MTRHVWVVAVFATAIPSVGAGQSSTVLLAEGIAAYRDLEFGTAIGLLERALAPNARPNLEGEQHTRALMHLGAAQLFSRRSNQAATTFQKLVVAYPTFSPDTVVFPPTVTRAFVQIRLSTQAAALAVPAHHSFIATDSALPITVEVSSPHIVTVVLEDERGRSLATIANERFTRRTVVRWDGRDADGNVVPAGGYRLRALSAAAPGTALRSVSVPIAVRHRSLPLVPEPAFPRERLLQESTGGVRTTLVISAFTLGSLIALPVLFEDTDHAAPRLAIGGSLGLAGIVELLAGSSGTPVPENRAHNTRVREEHERALQAARRQNARLAHLTCLEVRIGAPERREGS